MSVYRITVTDESGAPLADAHGDLDAMAYHTRKLNLVDGSTYTASLTEYEHIGGNQVRALADITGDAEIVNIVLGRRLRSARKATETPQEIQRAE